MTDKRTLKDILLDILLIILIALIVAPIAKNEEDIRKSLTKIRQYCGPIALIGLLEIIGGLYLIYILVF